jgi:hypothetical protein
MEQSLDKKITRGNEQSHVELQGEKPQHMGWKYAHFEIDLSKVRVRDVDPDWTYNHHNTSREVVRGWVENLREIQELCQRRGYTSADFEHLRDSSNAREAEMGRTYGYFYDQGRTNTGHVKVEWVKDHYEVSDGRHRILMAQEAGLTHMPALVAAPDSSTLEHLRTNSERLYAGSTPRRNQQVTPWMKLHPDTRNRPSEYSRFTPGRSGAPRISIEDTQVLLQQLQHFREIIISDWKSVMSQWQNLKNSWRDHQHTRFETFFDDLCQTFEQCEQQCEFHTQFLEDCIRGSEEAVSKIT